MANLTEYLTTKYTKMIAEISADLGSQIDRLTEVQNVLRALKNLNILVDGMPLTLDRLQVMEDGSHRILPPPPADTCQLEVSKTFSKKSKNGAEEPLVVLGQDRDAS